MKKIFLNTIICCLFSFNVLAQSFDATVNRTTIPEGETFVLTLDLKDVDSNASPDLSALNKYFTMFSISNGYRTNIVNGNVSKSRQWNLVLMPNQTGSLTIPSLEVAGYKSNPITLNVVPAGSEDQLVRSQSDNSPKFKMTGNISNNTPYVGEQINYQLKIYDAGGLQGDAPSFVSSSDDFVIKNLGEPKIETKIVNGQTLREITFNYALFAQRSGELTIPPIRFNGYYLTKTTRTDPFARFFDDDQFFAGFGLNDVFASRTPVVLNTKPIKINVKPQADGASGWWLPAKEVKLSAEFAQGKPEFKVGEAVSRTIYLKAVGVLDSQLPEIAFASVKGMKQYPEKPVTDMTLEGNDIVSYAQITNVYIPETAGQITLPEIKLNWFNTQTNSSEIATLPAMTVNIASSSTSVNTSSSSSDNTPNMQDTVPLPQEQASSQPTEVNTVPNNGFTIGYLLLAFVFGIVITLVLGKLFTKIANPSSNHKKAVISAAKNKDLRALRDELLLWATAEFPRHKITNLQDVADIFDNLGLNKELDKLRETLYADSSKDWDNKEFLKIFEQLSKHIKKHKRTKDDPLPKLYK